MNAKLCLFAWLLAVLIAAALDRLLRGRVVPFAIGLASFGIVSVLCGIAPTLEVLIVARLLQGAAGALLGGSRPHRRGR